MRISTAALHQQGIDNILRNQTALARTQNELASGTRLTRAADDPGDWARAARLDQRLAEFGRYSENADVARNRLGIEETALATASDTLNRVRELALQANGGIQSEESRRAIAQELQSRLQDLLSVANTTDGSGRHLFGGTLDGGAPFSLDAVGATYSGGAGVRVIDIAPERSLALGDTGTAVFQSLRTGNQTFAVNADTANTGSAHLTRARLADAAAWDDGSYTLSFAAGNYEVRDAGNVLVQSGPQVEGTGIRFRGVDLTLDGTPADGDVFHITPSAPQDLFALVQKVISLVQTSPADAAGRAQNQSGFFGALEELDAGLAHLSGVRGTVGNRLAAVDQAVEQVGALDVQAQELLSGLRDLDYAEAIGRLNLQMTALQAAQQSYSRIQGMSLFDFLR